MVDGAAGWFGQAVWRAAWTRRAAGSPWGAGVGDIYIPLHPKTKKIIYIYIYTYIYIKDCPTTIDFDWIARHFNRFRLFVSLSLGCFWGQFVVQSRGWLFFVVILSCWLFVHGEAVWGSL